MSKIAIIDDNENYLEAIVMYLNRNINSEIVVFSEVKDAFVYLLNDNTTDILVTDYRMPGWDGRNVIDVIVNYHPDMRIVVNTAYKEEFYSEFYEKAKDKYKQITHVVEKGSNKELVFSIEKAIEISLDMKNAQTSDILGLVSVAIAQDERYPHLKWHPRNVTCYSLSLAKLIKLNAAELRTIYKAGLLHDIGKIAIPDEIILKNGNLDTEEKKIIQKHPEIGVKILHMQKDEMMKDIIMHHHEMFNGSGYPHGLKAENIPPGARILAIADTYDAQTSDRPYRTAKTPQEALAELNRVKGVQLDPDLVDVFVKEKVFDTPHELNLSLEDLIKMYEAMIQK